MAKGYPAKTVPAIPHAFLPDLAPPAVGFLGRSSTRVYEAIWAVLGTPDDGFLFSTATRALLLP